MKAKSGFTRRGFLAGAAIAGGGLAFGMAGSLAGPGVALGGEGAVKGAAGVTPAEDLMFEHGVIERMVLIYREAAGLIEHGGGAPVAAIAATAGLARKFTENYHQKLEESQVFPHFEEQGILVGLVRTLKAQHAAARKVTDLVIELTRGDSVDDPKRLAGLLRAYGRMYSAHAARENSVLFRAFQGMLPAAEYRELGESFEDKEHELVGPHGFEETRSQVADIEKELGIHDLAGLTARV